MPKRNSSLRDWLAITLGCSLFASLLVTGCHSDSIASRRKANAPDYAALTAEEKALVDRGELKEGMSTNAIMIAWGKPQDVGQIATPNGPVTVWEYYRQVAIRLSATEEARLRAYYGTRPAEPARGAPMLHGNSVYGTVLYRTAAFQNGRLVSWHQESLP